MARLPKLSKRELARWRKYLKGQKVRVSILCDFCVLENYKRDKDKEGMNNVRAAIVNIADAGGSVFICDTHARELDILW